MNTENNKNQIILVKMKIGNILMYLLPVFFFPYASVYLGLWIIPPIFT